MESAVYQVSEDESSVEVCAVIRSPPGVVCPMDFSVSVTLSTSDETAGTYLTYVTMNCMFVWVHICICTVTHYHFAGVHLLLQVQAVCIVSDGLLYGTKLFVVFQN